MTAGPERLRERLAAIAAADLAAEMHRFLPVRQRTLLEERGYEPIRSAAQRVLERVSQTLDLK